MVNRKNYSACRTSPFEERSVGLVLLEADGLVLGLAVPPEEEGDAEEGQGHHRERSSVDL